MATTPSRPAPSKRANQSRATAGSVVAGVRWMGATTPASAVSSSARRARNGSARRSRSSMASRSKATNDAGVVSASSGHARGGGVDPLEQRVEVQTPGRRR